MLRRMSRLSRLAPVLCLLLAPAVARADTASDAREEIERRNIPYQMSEMCRAAQEGDVEVVRLFLDAGPNVNLKDWSDMTPLQSAAKWIGTQDNNVAEYLALLEALQCAVALNASKLHVYSDSEVVVRQMLGDYSCRSPRLYSLHWICRKLARSLDFSISHIRREHNAEANHLASTAARRRRVSKAV